MLAWAGRMAIDISAFPNLKAYQGRVAARPAVVAAMTSEGLLKAA